MICSKDGNSPLQACINNPPVSRVRMVPGLLTQNITLHCPDWGKEPVARSGDRREAGGGRAGQRAWHGCRAQMPEKGGAGGRSGRRSGLRKSRPPGCRPAPGFGGSGAAGEQRRGGGGRWGGRLGRPAPRCHAGWGAPQLGSARPGPAPARIAPGIPGPGHRLARGPGAPLRRAWLRPGGPAPAPGGCRLPVPGVAGQARPGRRGEARAPAPAAPVPHGRRPAPVDWRRRGVVAAGGGFPSLAGLIG